MLDTTSSATKFFIVVYMFQYSNCEEVYIHVFLKKTLFMLVQTGNLNWCGYWIITLLFETSSML
jgi:hypothetical protein